MQIYLLKRVLQCILLMVAVASIVFFLVHLIPGEPAVFILGENANSQEIALLHHQLHLDKPLGYQYLQFLTTLAQFNLGNSLISGQSVSQTILTIMPYTISLAVVAMFLAFLMSFPAGIWAAFKENTLIDTMVTLTSTIGSAMPNFFLGPLLIVFVSVKLGWLPISSSDGIKSILLPAFTLAISMSSLLTRIIKTSIATELKKPYILLAQAKGLRPYRIFYNHLFKNAMIPIITTTGLQFGALLTGTVITETVFSRPGIGSLLITGILKRDYPMIQGIVLFITFVYLLLSFFVDISYFLIDPRIKHEHKNKGLHG